MNNVLGWMKSPRTYTSEARRRPFRPTLALEHLQDRIAPATFKVMNLDNVDSGSLRQAIQDSNATTLMGNLIIGAPLGPVRPYVSGGAGLIRTRVADADEFFDIDDNSFGVNVGGGVMGFVSNNVGLRGDIRYFRSVQDSNGSSDIDLDFGTFDFWRGTFGVTFRF